ncbi:tumor necrosis factor receptor superfamily member 5 isoform X1 [Megalobrama amblycephala]|uniref:tumor necrosis factor receptor superfamily member 5 isoform X1 n=1 Tax=Megalobrama amblycephala TaxID=75352 RepID=UPI002013FE3A|nr:tumor necrosis factor receptor superfamily member 5 isoform X1 [Megalobrama amblycephala]
MRAAFFLYLLVTLVYHVSCCDKETHYTKDGKCCKMCGPGKRMLVDDKCEDPACQDCPNGEYQSGYTSETKCERQPSCDTNLHFKPQEDYPSKTSISKCKCEPGYYCTQEDDCNICMEHTVCKPGQRVAKKGSPVSDTVCEACKNGTFSTEDSADICKEWTTCEHGYDENAPGTSTSDRTCLGAPIHRVIIGVGVAVLVLLVVIIFIVLYKIKKNKGWMEFPKVDPKKTVSNLKKKQQETDVERAIQPLQQQPEEDIDNSVPVSPTPSNMTENGNFVVQELGKEHIISSTETNSYSYS